MAENEESHNAEENPAVTVRKLQEYTAGIIDAGAQKQIALWHWMLFNAYRQAGFNEDQALELVKTQILAGAKS